jgi:ribosomal protein S18 acetylase RimI-like enzyme
MYIPGIVKANSNDIPELVKLVNSAYRGDEAKQGWTHEADLIDGLLRVDEDAVEKILSDTSSVILTYVQNEKITGCVYLQQRKNTLYLGMLSVAPTSQANGIGKKLLQSAESYAVENHCSVIEMTVISIRHELIAWYVRHGYQITGKKIPFHTEARFGVPVKEIDFVVLEKKLPGSLRNHGTSEGQ